MADQHFLKVIIRDNDVSALSSAEQLAQLNVDLCVFLKRAILSGCVEIGLHGLDHGPEEFDEG